MKNILLIIVIAVVGYFGYNLFFANSSNPSQPADAVLFWGQGCPHCETVKKYIDDNKINQKLVIDQKEVYYNKANQALMEKAAKQCQMDTSQGLGVPFATIDGKCFVGDQPIIDALNQKISTK